MNIINANDSAVREFGYSRDELYKKSVFELHSEDELDHSGEVLDEIQHKKILTVETKFRRSDGSVFFAEATPCKYIIDDKPLIHVYIQDITEKKQAQKRLEEVNAALEVEIAKAEKHSKQLEEKNKELAQFAYIASHDLQEPLRTMVNFVQLLEEQYKGRLDQNADKYLKFITDASYRMSNLIKGLLDYSRIGRKSKLTMVNCNDLVQSVREDLDTLILESSATFEVGKLPKIKAYKTELRLIFQNLIGNAIKFHKKYLAPHIRITAHKEAKGWIFAVQDNGIGIKKIHQEKIFTIYQRLHNRNEYKGTGIGLSHCRKIASLHEGDIWVDSKPGIGSTFYFRIPFL